MPFADALLCTRHIADAMDGVAVARRLRFPERTCQEVEARGEEQRRRDQLKRVAGVVYYGEAWGYIKIGTSSNIEARVSDLRMTLLATEPGSYDVERKRHRQFAEHRKLGEYFHPAPALMAHIGAVRAEHGPPITTRKGQMEAARRRNGLT